MAAVHFTQYLRPDGRKVAVQIERPDPVVAKADHLVSHGFRFECEVLTTGDVSLTVSDDWGDYAMELAPNNEAVPASVDKMILEFDLAKALKCRKINQS